MHALSTEINEGKHKIAECVLFIHLLFRMQDEICKSIFPLNMQIRCVSLFLTMKTILLTIQWSSAESVVSG